MIIEIRKKDNNQIGMKTDAPINLHDFLVMVSTATLGMARQAVEKVEDEKKKKAAKEEIYDLINSAASSVLEQFAPEIEQRPDLTADAILKAENDIINKSSKEELKKYVDEDRK